MNRLRIKIKVPGCSTAGVVVRLVSLAAAWFGLLVVAPETAAQRQFSPRPTLTAEEELSLEAAPRVDLGYEHRQKGMRALGDGIYSSAARFFAAYREQTGGNEPDFTDATILLMRAHLLRGDLAAARRTLAYYDRESEGTEDQYYRRNLIYWRAALLVREGETEQALTILAPLLEDELFPELQEQARLLMGDAYAGSARWQEAWETIDEFLEKYPESGFRYQAKLNLVKIAVALENEEEAEKLLQQVGEQLGEDASAVVLHRILLQLAGGEIDQAMASFQTVVDEAPVAYERTWWLVFSQLARKLVAVERWEAGLQVLRKTRPLAPTSGERAEIMILQAECEMALEWNQEAILTLEGLLEKFPDHEEVPQARFRLALLAEKTNNSERAAEYYRNILDDQEMPLDLRYQSGIYLGTLIRQEENYATASSVYVEACRLPVDDARKAGAMMLAAEAAALAGNYAEAATFYQSVADNYADTDYAADARLRQAQTRVRAGRLVNAAAVFAQFIEEYSQDERLPEAWLGKAGALRDADRGEESIGAYEKFVAHFKEHEKAPGALMEIYRIAVAQGNMNRAMRALNRICTEYPESDLHTNAYYYRVHLAFQLGDYDLAVTEGERFVGDYEQLPLAADVLLWLADHYVNRGDPARAEAEYRRVALLFPGDARAAQALYEAASAAFAQENGADRALRLLNRLQAHCEEHGGGEMVIGRGAFLRGDVLAANHDFSQAAEWFEKAAQKLPEGDLNVAARGRVADMYFALDTEQSRARAVEIYRRLLQSETLNPDLRENITYRLGKALVETGEQAQALDLFLDIVFTYDMHTRVGRVRDWYYFARAAYEAARILVDKRQFDAAARIYERVYQSGIPTAEEARLRAQEIRRAHGLQE